VPIAWQFAAASGDSIGPLVLLHFVFGKGDIRGPPPQPLVESETASPGHGLLRPSREIGRFLIMLLSTR
jgi:hypothetical protein